jgi:hypothetical protein
LGEVSEAKDKEFSMEADEEEEEVSYWAN